MKLQEQVVMFFPRTMNLGGTENVVLQLCEIFKPLVKKIIICSCGGVNVEKLREMGIIHYSIPDIEKKTPRVIAEVSARIKKIVKKERITVIHTHHRMAAFYVRILGLDRKCIFINTSHNTFYDKKLLTRFAYKNCHLIACGEMVKKNLHDFYGLKKIYVIHNAVKPFKEKISIDEQLHKDRDEGGFLIGNVGRLSEQKGMEFFIKAVPEVISKHPEAVFYIIGSGENEEKLRALSDQIGAEVRFMGYRNDIQNIMSQLDLVVLSSLWEGLPLTPIEAFSVGKTIIATKVDGTPEIVKDGENGFLVEPKNADLIAEKINWLIEHHAEKKILEINASKTFDTEFNINVFAKSYIDYYSRIKC